jgi:hypothetical protein
VIALCALATAASCASLEPRNEAAELLLETAQLDQSELNKRSFGSSYGSYSPAFSHEENHVPVRLKIKLNMCHIQNLKIERDFTLCRTEMNDSSYLLLFLNILSS